MMYRCTIAYDGTAYHGWQIQEHSLTVAGTLTRSFKKAFGHDLEGLIAASRTDKGVHSYGQTVRCRTHISLDPNHLCEIWNRNLPSDIIIRDVRCSEDAFHPQHNVQEKWYWYHVFEKRPLPFYSRYGFFIPNTINIERLEQCLQFCVGTHDFRSFCTGEYDSTIRTINRIQVQRIPRYHAVRIGICGPSFLYLMVRRIVGSALYIASRQKLSAALFQEIFEKCNPLHMLPTAPARGLLLRKIVYNNRE